MAVILACGLYVLADVYSPLENKTREWASPVLALLLLVLLAALLTHAWRRNPADLARKADSANHDARQTVLSFWEMSRSPFAAESSGHSLGAWLMGGNGARRPFPAGAIRAERPPVAPVEKKIRMGPAFAAGHVRGAGLMEPGCGRSAVRQAVHSVGGHTAPFPLPF